MPDATPPTTTGPHQLDGQSDWVYPTGAYYGDYPYTYSGGTYHYNPQSTPHPAALGSTRDENRATRGVNYFFGFLITFITLLLLFVVCGVGSRRRAAARRTRDMSEEGILRPVTFRGLLAASQPGRGRLGSNESSEQEILKQKPTYHEVRIAPADEKRPEWNHLKQKARSVDLGGAQRMGSEAWFALEVRISIILLLKHSHHANMLSRS